MRRISPDDVAAHIGCSRRLAELRFSQICGMTLHKAITSTRMNEVKRRIQHGESTDEIVRSLDFSSANQLYQMYKRHFGHPLRKS